MTKTIKALRFIINSSYKILVFLTEFIDKVTPTAGSKKVIGCNAWRHLFHVSWFYPQSLFSDLQESAVT